MRYSDFSVHDFTMDEYFQSWVFSPGDENLRHFWETWLSQHPDKRSDVMEAKRILESIRFANHSLSGEQVAHLWNRIHQAPSNKRISRVGSIYRMVAASIVIALVSMFYWWSQSKPWLEYHTTFGETRNVTLPDGSSVVLNANSTLTLLSDWNDDSSREIWLDGEAFFSVTHKKNNQLFKVNTKEGVTVEVLGTTFNVYNRTNGTKVVLNSGHIRLNLPTAQSEEMILMKPGEMVEYKSKRYKKKEVDPQLYTAWTSNKIILDHTSLAEMVYMLKDSYGLEVKVSDTSLLEQTVSGSMPLGNAEILLQQMARAFQLRIKREGNVIVVEEEGDRSN